MRIAIASDHAGFQLKELLLNRLADERDVSFVDLGTHAVAASARDSAAWRTSVVVERSAA